QIHDTHAFLTTVQEIVCALKPTIDALSTLLFLGEYHQHMAAAYKAVARLFSKLMSKKGQPGATVTLVQPAQPPLPYGVPSEFASNWNNRRVTWPAPSMVPVS
ncbi:hypothetical protein AAVH_40534, partial [Aphelenchoides avenae]